MTNQDLPGRKTDDALPALICALRDAECFDHPTDTITILQTHISYVFHTGSYAYKKKSRSACLSSTSAPWNFANTIAMRNCASIGGSRRICTWMSCPSPAHPRRPV